MVANQLQVGEGLVVRSISLRSQNVELGITSDGVPNMKSEKQDGTSGKAFKLLLLALLADTSRIADYVIDCTLK